jgi:hypothetical protein
MRNPIEIDYSHSRAIIQDIGERLRMSLKEDRDLKWTPDLEPWIAEVKV